MNFNNLKNKNIPEEFYVVIEIAENTKGVKYEIDKDIGILKVDRFLSTSMYYPTNYGFIPNTLGEDGDPLDVLVLSPETLAIGSMINCRPIAALITKDESGGDNKILAVPTKKICPMYANIDSIEDIPTQLLNKIEHFFEHYKDLELNKWVKVDKWVDREEAKKMIIKSDANYK